MRTIYLVAAMAMACVTTATLAGDEEFKGDAAPTWAARSLLMAKVYDDAADHTLNKQSFAVACDGITGEQMKYEYGKVPKWALQAHLEVCVAFNAYAGKFGASKKPCANMKKAIGFLQNATAPGTPAEVTSSAATLSQALAAILDATEGGKHGCHM